MNKFVNGMLLATMAIALVLTGCDDEKDIIPPTTVTLSGGNSSTDFNAFVFTAFSFFGVRPLTYNLRLIRFGRLRSVYNYRMLDYTVYPAKSSTAARIKALKSPVSL